MKKNVTCPYCGEIHSVELSGIAPYRRKGYASRKKGEFTLILDGEAEEIAQDYTISVQIQQVTIIGGFAFGASLCLIAAGQNAGAYVVMPEVAASLSAAFGFLTSLTSFFILSQAEFFIVKFARSIARGWQSGQRLAPEPLPDPNVLRVAIEEREMPQGMERNLSNNGSFSRYLGEIPCKREQFVLWAKNAIGGGSIAIAQWYGEGKPFTRAGYEKMIDYLSEFPSGSPIVEKSENGNRVTSMGKKILIRILREWGELPPLLEYTP